MDEERPDRGSVGVRNVWVTSGTSFLTDVSSEMLQNVLPLFLANVLGVRVWAVGAVEGLAESTSALLKLYSGWLSDRLRARKWLAVAGYGISALSKPFYYLAGTWTAVAGVRWADRVGKGVRTAPRDALLADSVPPDRRGWAFGVHRAADTAGAAVGILVTLAVVAAVQGNAGLLAEGTFRSLVLWSLVPAFLAVLLLAAGARDVPVHAAGERPPRPTLTGLGRPFLGFLAASALFELGNSSDAFLILRAQERGLGVLGVLWTLLAFNVVYALSAAPAGALADRLSRKQLLFAGWGLYAVVYLGFAMAATAASVVTLFVLYGAYYGLTAGAAKALVADLVPAHSRGTAFGTYHAVVGLLSLPASLLAGVLWEGLGSWSGFGPAAPFLFGAGAAVAAGLTLWLWVPEGGSRTAGSAVDPVIVVAAVILREGRYLVGRRPDHKRHGGLWEFPGGKLRDGEDLRAAATRELAEELDLTLEETGTVLWSARDPGSPFLIRFLEVQARGEPRAREHTRVAWCDLAELAALPLAPADAAFVAFLSD